MISALMLALALAAGPQNPVAGALAEFARVSTYQVTLRSWPGNEIIRYYYEKPGFVRMEFVRPHAGAVLVYDPDRKLAKLWPFGRTLPLSLTLKPDSPLLRSSHGHRVEASDIGTLLGRAKSLQDHGQAEVLGDDQIGDRRAWRVEVAAVDDFTVDGVHRYRLWLDQDSLLPLKAQAFGPDNQLVEEVLMDDLIFNAPLPDQLFKF
jgi:outer membrane lipoprotein-sorting protein